MPVKVVLLILGIIGWQILLQAQTKPFIQKQDFGIILGNVIGADKGDAIAYAKLEVRIKKTDSLLRTSLSDKNGAFEFDKLPFGYYTLSISAIGYAKTILDSIYIRAERYDFNMGDIKLNIATQVLNEVIVYAEKPLIENKDDKLIYNVGESALSGGATTAELLKNIPLVNNDPNGRILLKGKEPKILIDDKPTELTPQQLQDLLESLPGSSIEKIEIMINPPPQFATESGGVINIVTRKGKIGWVGKLTLSAGTRGEGNVSANISYRNKKLSFNQTIGSGFNQQIGNSYSTRTNFYTDSTNYFKTTGNYTNTNSRPNIRSQVDYEVNKNSTYGLVYQGNLNFYDNNSFNTFTHINRFNEIYRYSTRENHSVGQGYTHGITLSYTHKGKNPVEMLRLIVVGNANKNDNDRNFYQQFLQLNIQPFALDSTQSQYFNNSNRSANFRLEYTKPLKKKANTFSGGATYNMARFHNSLNTTFLRKIDGVMINNDKLSNNFFFDQYITTVRAGFSILLPKAFRLTVGAQAEYTDMRFHFFKGNVANVANAYWNLLPNFTIRKDFSKQVNTALVYRATIRRPGIGELNPNIDYGDPYNLRFGNPFLQPSLSHNIDWNISITKGKYYINTSLGFNKVQNVFNTIRTLIDNGITQITWLNIADRNEYEASVFGGYTFSKKFRMNASAGYTYNEYSEREKQLYLYRNGSTFYTSLNYSYTPSPLWNIEGTARFNNFADPQGRSRSNISSNFGIQRKLFDRRLIIGFNIIDPFMVQQYVTVSQGPRFYIESVNNTVTRNYRFTISYQLNKIVQKSTLTDKQKKAALDKLKK
jgi:outer membrane receptor protein involved in Fe transport